MPDIVVPSIDFRDDSNWGPWITRTIDDHYRVPDGNPIVQVKFDDDVTHGEMARFASTWSWYYRVRDDGTPTKSTIREYRCLNGQWTDTIDVSTIKLKLQIRNIIQILYKGSEKYSSYVLNYQRDIDEVDLYCKSGDITSIKYFKPSSGDTDLDRFRRFFSANPIM